MRRVALYARVSTADQDAEPQLKVLREWAERQGFAVGLEAFDVASGRSADRPGLESVIKAVRSRQVAGVAVVKLDRWGRSAADASRTIRSLWDRSGAFWAIDQGLTLDPMADPLGVSTSRLMLTLLAAVAEFEADLISERTSAALVAVRERLKREGRNLGRVPAPCHDCGSTRQDRAMWGKRSGVRVPLCPDCKASGSRNGGVRALKGGDPILPGSTNGRFSTGGDA